MEKERRGACLEISCYSEALLRVARPGRLGDNAAHGRGVWCALCGRSQLSQKAWGDTTSGGGLLVNTPRWALSSPWDRQQPAGYPREAWLGRPAHSTASGLGAGRMGHLPALRRRGLPAPEVLTHTHAHMHTHTHTRIHMHTRTRTRARAHCTRTHAHARACTHVCVMGVV